MSSPAFASAPLRPPRPPPAPDGIGGLGVLMRLRRNGFSAFPARCLREPVVRLNAPGGAVFVVSDGAAIAEMLQTRSADFARVPAGRRVMGPITGRGLLTAEGEAWKRQRHAMAPAFAPRAVPLMAAHVVRITHDACDDLARRAHAPVDLLAEMQALSLQIASVSMFSVEAGAFQAELRARIAGYMAGAGRPFPEDFLLPGWVPTPLMLRRRAFRRRWTRLIGRVVAERRARGVGGEARDLFDLLAEACGESDDALLVDEVATLLVAGHETTALTLFWALHLLAQAPAWREAVAAEAAALDLAPERAAEALPALRITRAVVNETLRLYSPAFMTARVARRATSVAGHVAPRGALMLAPFWIAHRDPRRWTDPERFAPERFLDDPAATRAGFMPFGAGPRVCIGAQLAMTEAVLVLALMLRRWAPRPLDPGRPVLPVATLSTRPDHAPLFHLEDIVG